MKLWTQNLSVRPRKFWLKTLWCDFEDCTHQTILTSREDQLTCPVTLTPWISNAWHVKIAIAAFNLPGGSVARVNPARPLLECVSPRSQVAKLLGPFMYHVSISGRTNVSYTYAHLSGTWRTNSVTLSLHTTWLITHLMVSILHEVKWNPTTPCFPSILHGYKRQKLTYPRTSLDASTSHTTRRHNSYDWPACALTCAWFLWLYSMHGRRERSTERLCLFPKSKK